VSASPGRLLTWDSDFFGITIGELLTHRIDEPALAGIRRWIAANEIACTYFAADLSDPETIAIASREAWFLADVRMEFRLAGPVPAAGEARSDCVPVRDAQAADVDHVRAVFREVAAVSRFRFDRRFPADKADRMYEMWAEPSDGPALGRLVVGETDGVIGGAALYRVGERTTDGACQGEIGLIGVRPQYRRTGLGRALTDMVCRRMFEAGCGGITVVTQGRNIPSQRLYIECGFQVSRIHAYYHIWSTPAPT
jgi:ribosomal protein S18 acetylase RimI-like enzyme